MQVRQRPGACSYTRRYSPRNSPRCRRGGLTQCYAGSPAGGVQRGSAPAEITVRWVQSGHRRVASLQVRQPLRTSALLIIRRSRVRSPAAPPSPTCVSRSPSVNAERWLRMRLRFAFGPGRSGRSMLPSRSTASRISGQSATSCGWRLCALKATRRGLAAKPYIMDHVKRSPGHAPGKSGACTSAGSYCVSSPCTKCNCPDFLPKSPGLFLDGSDGLRPGYLVKPSRKCSCGHLSRAHTAKHQRGSDPERRGGAVVPPPNSHGAIAYSAHDERFRYTYACASRSEAEGTALRSLGAADAEIIGWACDAFMAIAGPDGPGHFGVSGGYTREEAERDALANCTGSDPQILLSFHTRLHQPMGP